MIQQTNFFSLKCLQNVALLVLLLNLSTGCAKLGQFPTKLIDNSNLSSGIETPDDGAATTPTTPETPVSEYKMVPLVWESTSYPERKQWSAYLQKLILEEWHSLLPGASDMTLFCPTYNKLDDNQRANVWAQLFAAVTKYESAYSPVSRMQETTMGTDPVTGKAVYSEGLLQLSYQDVQWAPWCDFDWSKDKSLSATSTKKTILDPYINLDCGVGIMADQIKRKGAIILNSGVYWAVLKGNGAYQQISGIQSIVKSLSLCK
jgi:hypothetical protein